MPVYRPLLAAAGLSALLAACGAPDPETPAAQPPAQASASTPMAVITAQQIETAVPMAPDQMPTPPADGAQTRTAPDPGLVRLQILLDRSPYSPGIIDGLAGENTRQAVAAYRKANNLGGDTIDAALLERLAGEVQGPVMTTYVVTEADVAGPFSPPATSDLQAQAAGGANYVNAREALAERFHVSEALLEALNPGVDFSRAGQRLVVPAVADQTLTEVARIVVDKTEKSLRAFDGSGKLIAFYPATIGSTQRPAPSGALRVLGVAKNPDYTYDPDKLSYDRGDEKVVVPPGPNNPVGSVWIDLSRESYGIHGTPEPSKISKTASNGCIRLTNWDAQQLAAAVKPGVVVEFV